MLVLTCFVVLIIEIVKDKSWFSPEEETGLLKVPGSQAKEYGDTNKASQKYELPNKDQENECDKEQEDCEKKEGEQFQFDSNEKSEDKHVKGNDEPKEEQENPYMPYDTKKKQDYEEATFQIDFVPMQLREEVWYHLLYHMIVLGMCCISWHSPAVMAFAYIHLACFCVWITMRILENQFAKFAMFSMVGCNTLLAVFALANYNKS